MIIVIGAGPAGLSAAYHLSTDCLVLERESEPGGLCRSFELAGAQFDLGGHAFFTKHDYVESLLAEFGVELYEQPRQAWVYAHGCFVPYPFQSNLYGLPAEVVEECLVGLFRAATANDCGAPANLQEWIDRSFGSGIAKHFMTPYNTKLWAFPLSEVVPEWASERVVMPNVDEVIAGAVRRAGFSRFPNAMVRYPVTNGFAELYKPIAAAVRERLIRADVQHIDMRRRRVLIDTGEWLAYDALLSTMPLDELVRSASGLPETCHAATASLRHNSLHLVNLVFRAEALRTEMQRVYAPAASLPFHKLVLNFNSSPSLRNRLTVGIQAEVSFSSAKTVDRDSLPERVRASIVDMGLLDADEHPVASSIVTLDRAYPVYTAETSAVRNAVLSELARHDVMCAGRFGEWLYINSDAAVMRGKKRAEQLNATTVG